MSASWVLLMPLTAFAFRQVGMELRQYPGIPPDGKTGPPCSTTPLANPSFQPCSPTKAYYTEKLQVGYRWYAANSVQVRVPTGMQSGRITQVYNIVVKMQNGQSKTLSMRFGDDFRDVGGAEGAPCPRCARMQGDRENVGILGL